MSAFLAATTIRAGADPLIHAVKHGQAHRKRPEAVCGARAAQITGEFVEWSSRACAYCSSIVRYLTEGKPDVLDGRRGRPSGRAEGAPTKPLGPSEWRCFVCDVDCLTPERLESHETRVHGEEPVSA